MTANVAQTRLTSEAGEWGSEVDAGQRS
jgi:hypothetical protein